MFIGSNTLYVDGESQGCSNFFLPLFAKIYQVYHPKVPWTTLVTVVMSIEDRSPQVEARAIGLGLLHMGQSVGLAGELWEITMKSPFLSP